MWVGTYAHSVRQYTRNKLILCSNRQILGSEKSTWGALKFCGFSVLVALVPRLAIVGIGGSLVSHMQQTCVTPAWTGVFGFAPY